MPELAGIGYPVLATRKGPADRWLARKSNNGARGKTSSAFAKPRNPQLKLTISNAARPQANFRNVEAENFRLIRNVNKVRAAARKISEPAGPRNQVADV